MDKINTCLNDLNNMEISSDDPLKTCELTAKKVQKMLECNKYIKDFNDNQDKLYQQSYDDWLQKKTEWIKLTNDHNNKINEFNTRTGRYTFLNDKWNELTNETKLWKNCVDGNLYCIWGKKNEWCVDDFGEGWYQSGCVQSNCGAYRKGECKRTDTKRNSDYNDYAKQFYPGDKPAEFTLEEPKINTGKYTHFSLLANFPTIQCCRNEINTTSLTENVLQSCFEKINSLTPSSSTTPTSPTTPTTPTSPASPTTPTSPASPTTPTSPASPTTPTSPASPTSSTTPTTTTPTTTPTTLTIPTETRIIVFVLILLLIISLSIILI